MLFTLSQIGARNKVVAFTVHEPPEPAVNAVERAEDLVFVPDGFNWFAFLLAPIWMLVNRMWAVLLAYIGAVALLGVALAFIDPGSVWTAVANLALNLVVAFEADGLRRWTLARKGWRTVGTVSGASERECERRFFEQWLGQEAQ